MKTIPLIDYINMIHVPKMTKKQKKAMEKIYKSLREICKDKKVLVVDSMSSLREWKEIK